MSMCKGTQASVLLLALYVLPAVSTTCYYPDGHTTAPDVPCNQTAFDDGGHTPCCNGGNLCLDNGLCIGNGIVSRGSCTDPDWGDACPQWCKDENPTGGMPITPCDIWSVTFACNVDKTACKDANPPFHIPDGNGVILRAHQVAPLEASGSSVAMLVNASTILTPMQDASNELVGDKHTVTVTASPNGAAGVFSTADMAGAAVGLGAPLLFALVGAVILVFYQRRKLEEVKSALENREKMDRASYGQMMQTHASVPMYSPSNRAPYTHLRRDGRFVPEMDNSNVNEMSSGRSVLEMDSRQQGA